MSSTFRLCRLSLLSKSQNSWVVSASLNSLHFCIHFSEFLTYTPTPRLHPLSGRLRNAANYMKVFNRIQK